MKQKIKAVCVHVNGKEIELNSFVRALIGNTVIGMVSSLKLDGIPKHIEVSVTAQPSTKRKLKA